VPFVWGAEQVYQRPEDFVREAFGGHPPPAKVLWLTGERKKAVTRILGHPPPRLRVRYWLQGGTSVWILEEIGKERPITVGVVVENGRMAMRSGTTSSPASSRARRCRTVRASIVVSTGSPAPPFPCVR